MPVFYAPVEMNDVPDPEKPSSPRK